VRTVIFLSILTIFVLLWIYVVFPEWHNFAVFYLFSTLLCLLIYGLEYATSGGFPTNVYVLKFRWLDIPASAVIFVLTYGFAELFMRVTGMTVVIPYAAMVFISPPLLNMMLMAFLVPFVEEVLIAGLLLPTSIAVLKEARLPSLPGGLILSAVFYATSHIVAFNAQLPFLIVAAFYSILSGLYAYWSKSFSTPLLVHAYINVVVLLPQLFA